MDCKLFVAHLPLFVPQIVSVCSCRESAESRDGLTCALLRACTAPMSQVSRALGRWADAHAGHTANDTELARLTTVLSTASQQYATVGALLSFLAS